MRRTTNYSFILYDEDDKMRITNSSDSLNATMEEIDRVLNEKASMEDVENYIDQIASEIETLLGAI